MGRGVSPSPVPAGSLMDLQTRVEKLERAVIELTLELAADDIHHVPQGWWVSLRVRGYSGPVTGVVDKPISLNVHLRESNQGGSIQFPTSAVTAVERQQPRSPAAPKPAPVPLRPVVPPARVPASHRLPRRK